jgi:RNA polymerase sigma-70 factor (ECF subfamily)
VEDSRAERRASLEEGPDLQVGRRQLQAALVSAMRQLSPRHRAAVGLAYFYEFGYREIGEIMHCPVETAKTRVFYARRHLRRVLAGALQD